MGRKAGEEATRKVLKQSLELKHTYVLGLVRGGILGRLGR